MKTHKGLLVIVPVIVLLSLAAERLSAAEDAILIITHKSATISKLDNETLRSVFLGQKTFWETGGRIAPIMRPPSVPAGKLFFQDILAMVPGRFHHHWSGLELSGAGVAPSAVASPQDVARLVSANPGAIGFITEAELPLIAKFQVKSTRSTR